MKQFRCSAVVFDLDGVLVDSTTCVERHWHKWADRHGLDRTAILAMSHGRRTIETMRAVAPHLAVDDEARQLDRDMVEDTVDVAAPQGTAELLAVLDPTNWAVVTSESHLLATARLHAAGLPLPSIFVTGDDVSHGKPDPEGYLKAARLLNVAPEEFVVIEDIPVGIEAARAAQMIVIAVATTRLPAH